MFTAALKAVKSHKPDERSSSDLLILPPDYLPDEYSLTALDKILLADDQIRTLLDKFERFYILNTCLSHVERLRKESSSSSSSGDDDDDDDKTTHHLTWKISQLILPEGNKILSDEVLEAEKQNSLYLTRHIVNFGLSSLVHLQGLSKAPKDIFQSQIILNLLAFTSISDVWTSPFSLKTAEYFLSLYSSQAIDSEFITNKVLASFVRPLFISSSVPKTITASSRAASQAVIPPEPHDFSTWDSTSKPWRLDTCYTLTVLSWAIRNASHETILASFHLIIPPILILLDSPKIPYRVQGLRILVPFLQKLTPTLLQQTGLGSVIEDAIHPTLLYLPPITPAADSISILPVAYEALFVLFETRFPSTISGRSGPQRTVGQKEKVVYLTRILRHAIVPSHQHTVLSSASNAKIQEIIFTQLSRLIRLLGTDSIAHLNLLLPMVSDLLLDPFVTASLPTMRAAVKALREIVLCAWPRIGEEEKRRIIIKIIASAWKEIRAAHENCNVEEDLAQLREDLKIVGKIFSKAVQALKTSDLCQEMKPLFEVDLSLRDVFGI
ncbi:hypothetical protein K3495_g6660 [Podosphaera aphanis]|nr:hypothetical protein K3495_g6660 [Podosphaera aphanis]